MNLISERQCRAARALLSWSQPDLAQKSGLHVQTISMFEKGAKIPSRRTLQALATTLSAHGIVFLEDNGVQQKANRVMTLEGAKSLDTFIMDVYEQTRLTNKDVCVSNVNEDMFTDNLTPEIDQDYMGKMHALKKDRSFDFRVLIKEGDYNLAAAYAEYRWTPKEYFSPVPFYVYGDKLAFLFFEDDITIHIIDHPDIARAQRIQFDLFWRQAIVPPVLAG